MRRNPKFSQNRKFWQISPPLRLRLSPTRNFRRRLKRLSLRKNPRNRRRRNIRRRRNKRREKKKKRRKRGLPSQRKWSGRER